MEPARQRTHYSRRVAAATAHDPRQVWRSRGPCRQRGRRGAGRSGAGGWLSTTDEKRTNGGGVRGDVASVAIVDDDASVRGALARLFRVAGFDVAAFGSPRDYLAACHGAHQPSCLVLDVYLDGMTGFELQDVLAAAGHPPPVVFITAHDELSARELTRRAGPGGFLRKPFDDEALLAAVRRAIAYG